MSIARSHCEGGVPLVVFLVIAAPGCSDKNPKPVQMPPPTVMVALPIERTVTDFQIFTARTKAVQSVDIKCRVTGYLTEIRFKDGDLVDEGKVLFKIDDRPYKAALDQAKASLEFAKAALVKTQADYDIGLAVQKQDKGAISTQEITKRLGSRDEAKASVDQADAVLKNAQLNFDWCTVVSPLAGRANTHFVDVGNLVTQNVTTLTNIVSIKPMWAYFDVDENTARHYQELVAKGDVQAARKDEIPIAMSLAGDKSFPTEGVIDFVSNQLDPNTGSIRVRAVFPNKSGSLLAGLFGRIRVPSSAPHQALLVADSAIGTNQGQRFVLVVNSKDTVEYRIVDVGQLHDGLREVMRFREVSETSPTGEVQIKKVEVLKPTDRVIVDGLQRVRPGGDVEPKPVDMTTLLVQPEPEAKKTSPKRK
jgi:RND family efflux transporter MFP subunit